MTKGIKQRGNGEGTVVAYKIKTSSKQYYQAELKRIVIINGQYNKRTFKLRFDENGERFSREKDARQVIPTLRMQADAWEAALKAPTASGKRKEDYTLRDLWNAYSAGHLQNTSKGFQAHMNRSIKYCSEFMDKKWREIEALDFQSIIDRSSDSYDCKKKTKTLLTSLSKIAIKVGTVDYDRTGVVELPQEPKRHKAFFTEKELQRLYKIYRGESEFGLLSGNDKMACAQLLILSTTGMRPGELLKVRNENIDFKKMLIGDAGIKTPISINRYVPMIPETVDIIKDFCTPVNQFTLVSDTTMRKRIRAFLSRVGMEYRVPSSGRKTFSTCNAINNVNAEVNRQALGHAPGSKITEKHYIERSATFVQKEIAAKFNLENKKQPDSVNIDEIFEQAKKALSPELLSVLLELAQEATKKQ